MSLNMPKLRKTLMPKYLHALFLVGLFCGVQVYAQETLPDSKGELKDFRLDNPPPKEAPAEPAPKAEAPAEKTAPKAAAPSPKPISRADQPKPAPKANLPTPDTSTDQPEAQVSTGLDAFSDTPPPSDTSDTVISKEAASTATPAMTDYFQYWPWLAAVLATLLAFLLLWVWKRRRSETVVVVQSFAAEPFPAPPMRAPPIPPPAAPPVRAGGGLTLRFDPGDARLSMANLTVKGHLHLRYDGDAPLDTVKLRTRVMSACDGQKALIDSFHSDPSAGEIESLGPVVPGEEIDLTLEMQVPRDALQAFDWRERRFVAPIVLINVASDDDAITPCRVSCVVGQEGGAGSARLLPIPIDRGPKLFAALQFRPIAA